MLNDTNSTATYTNQSCDCPIHFITSLESSRGTFANTLCMLAIISNLFTILVLRRIKKRCSTDNLLLAITVVDLMLPILFLVRHVYATLGKDWSYRVYMFYLWLVFYNTSILLTLVLAARRFMAIEYPHAYQRQKHRYTRNMILAIFLFCVLLFLPFCWYRPELNKAYCKFDPMRDLLYTVMVLDMVYKKNSMFRSSYLFWQYMYLVYWLYICFFQILCPLILAGLSYKFQVALKRKLSAPKHKLMKNKTKMILLVSLIVVVRDLPFGLMAASRHFVRMHTGCLTTMRLVTKELTVLMSVLNFVVLYATNEKFKKAVPWPKFSSREDVSPSDRNQAPPTAPSLSVLTNVSTKD